AARPGAAEADAPAGETRVGELDDRPVSAAAGELEGFRSVPRDPDGETGFRRPVEAQLGVLVGDLAAFAEVADDVGRLLEEREVRRRLPEGPPRRIAATYAARHRPPASLLRHRQD